MKYIQRARLWVNGWRVCSFLEWSAEDCSVADGWHYDSEHDKYYFRRRSW